MKMMIVKIMMMITANSTTQVHSKGIKHSRFLVFLHPESFPFERWLQLLLFLCLLLLSFVLGVFFCLLLGAVRAVACGALSIIIIFLHAPRIHVIILLLDFEVEFLQAGIKIPC